MAPITTLPARTEEVPLLGDKPGAAGTLDADLRTTSAMECDGLAVDCMVEVPPEIYTGRDQGRIAVEKGQRDKEKQQLQLCLRRNLASSGSPRPGFRTRLQAADICRHRRQGAVWTRASCSPSPKVLNTVAAETKPQHRGGQNENSGNEW